MAPAPAASARATSAADADRDRDTKSWTQTGGRPAAGPAVAAHTSSTRVFESDDKHITVPSAAAARAVASSPASHASLWNAVGATRMGIETGAPRTVVERSRSDTSTRTR